VIGWYNTYGSQGLSVILAVGESGAKAPATVADAKAYRESHGYPDGVHVIADPNWNGIQSVVKHSGGSMGLPNFVVLDGLMTFHYIGGDMGAVENKIIELLNE